MGHERRDEHCDVRHNTEQHRMYHNTIKLSTSPLTCGPHDQAQQATRHLEQVRVGFHAQLFHLLVGEEVLLHLA